MSGRQPRPQHLPGLHIQPAPDDRTGVNIQPDTRTLTDHWGLPTPVALPPGPPPARQPTIIRGGAPAPIPSRARASTTCIGTSIPVQEPDCFLAQLKFNALPRLPQEIPDDFQSPSVIVTDIVTGRTY